jgi:hypothetical protein
MGWRGTAVWDRPKLRLGRAPGRSQSLDRSSEPTPPSNSGSAAARAEPAAPPSTGGRRTASCTTSSDVRHSPRPLRRSPTGRPLLLLLRSRRLIGNEELRRGTSLTVLSKLTTPS